ncbi:Protein K07C11.10 [Aphelenchoides avenae]|nr:Protein K07C11.10 [Aphelenchus avenae]
MESGVREYVWPPNGYCFKEESLSPVFCKPKLIPLKSVTLEKLEKMQAEAMEKLKEMERMAAQEKEKVNGEASDTSKQADIWQADA